LDGGPHGEGEVGGGGVSYSLDNCPASEELAPNRHQIISVPLYIPYSFMGQTHEFYCETELKTWCWEFEFEFYIGTGELEI